MEDPTDIEPLRAELRRLQYENARLADLLEIAQEFGRLGVFERNPKTLEGRWDRHVFRLYGFPEGRTPHFEEARKRIHPEDRYAEAFLASLRAPGQHDFRYRVLRPDGLTSYLHSHWRVIAGANGQPERVLGVLVDDTESRELAQQAKAANDRLELALALAGIGLWRYVFATGRVHYDDRAQQILGRAMVPEGVPLATVREWIHPDDLPEVTQAFERALAGSTSIDTQTRYLHADGRWRTLLSRRVVQRDSSGRPEIMIGVSVDVTEQQHQMMASLSLARRLESAAEAARVGLWSGPLDGNGAAEWNERMYDLLGRDRALGPANLGDALRLYAHPEERDRIGAEVLAWMRGPLHQSLTLTVRVVRPDASERWIEVRSYLETDAQDVRRAYGVMLDVTEQRQVLNQMREQHERVTLALSAVGMGTWSRDLRTGRDEWDEQMFRLRGLEPSDEVPSETARKALVVPEDRAAFDGLLMPFTESSEPLAYEFRIQRPDGAVRTLASRSVALTDEHGVAYRRIGVNWDVTDARFAEQAQREHEIAVRENRSRSALLSRVSHELRTPLNAILGFTQLMLTSSAGTDPQQHRRRLQQIASAGENLLSLVDSVLELNELSDAPLPEAPEAVELGPVVERAIDVVRADAANRGIQLACQLEPASVLAEPRRVQQIVNHLLAHATSRSQRDTAVSVRCAVDGPEVALSVSDSGALIPAELASRLFEPLGDAAQAGAAGARLGLGLALAHAHAMRLGGQLRLVHSDAQRTTFELRLRAAPRARATIKASPRSVLYIEDNDVNMLIVRELLAQRSDIEFHGAPNGLQGVAMATALHPSVVLVDMQLPDFDGMEVLRRLRANPDTASLVCVALSANAMPEDVNQAKTAGFADYWTKPIDLTAFLNAINRLVPPA